MLQTNCGKTSCHRLQGTDNSPLTGINPSALAEYSIRQSSLDIEGMLKGRIPSSQLLSITVDETAAKAKGNDRATTQSQKRQGPKKQMPASKPKKPKTEDP